MAAQLGFFAQNREFFRLYLSLRMPEGTPARQRRQKQHLPSAVPAARGEDGAASSTQAMERGEIRAAWTPYRLALFIIEGSTAVILERLTENIVAGGERRRRSHGRTDPRRHSETELT